MTVIMACNILHFKSFGHTVDSWLIVSNEAALIIVIYFMMSFSEWISDASLRRNFGTQVIVFVLIIQAIYLYLLAKQCVKVLLKWMRKRKSTKAEGRKIDNENNLSESVSGKASGDESEENS